MALRKAIVWVAALAALAATGCGSGGGGGKVAEGEPATVKVGVIPIVDVAPLYLGREKGFFKREKLTIKPQLAEGGAAIVPSVLSGDFQFGFSNVTSLLIGSSKGLPLRMVAQGAAGASRPDANAYDAVLVDKSGPVRSPKDLEGKTVAVNTLQNVGPLTINAALEKAGADYKKVKYVEVPFPDMSAALEAGRVDAAWVVEPFVTQGRRSGARPLIYPFEETAADFTVAGYFTTEAYQKRNPDVVARFVRGMRRSLEYAERHPDEVRRVIGTYTKIPPEVAGTMKLPRWRVDVGRPTIERTATLAERYDFVKKPPDVDALLGGDKGR